MLAYRVFMLLCLLRAASGSLIYRESGESVTLKCSARGYFQSRDQYVFMYLYHEFITRDEVFYWPSFSSSMSPRERYDGRIQSTGVFIDHNVTISNLTVNDSGHYTCVYNELKTANKCNEYTLVVRGPSPCAETPAEAKTPQPLMCQVYRDCLIAAVSCIFIVPLIVVLLPKVKKRCSRRRPISPEFTVYEDMTRKNFHRVEFAEE